jgi:hypothetical protein
MVGRRKVIGRRAQTVEANNVAHPQVKQVLGENATSSVPNSFLKPLSEFLQSEFQTNTTQPSSTPHSVCPHSVPRRILGQTRR